MIEIKNLNFSYEFNVILENINLNITDGDYIAITGSNGVGKSTLLKCLLGINKIEDNTIFVDGNDLNKVKKNIFGYVPQFRNNLTDIPITAFEFLNKTSIDVSKIHEVIKSLNIDYQNQLFKNLSGGQKQRLYIAKALMKNAKYLILDEPTVGIDEISKQSFYELLHQLNQQKITIILINHNFEEIIHRVHKIYNLETKEVIINNDCRYC